MRAVGRVLGVACACVVAASCSLLDSKKDESSSSPTSPSPTVGMDAFAGTWSSVSASTPATGCGNVQYTVTPVSSSSGTVSFTAICGGTINVNGAGTGSISGSTLNWSANGLVSQGGVNCPFTLSNGTATQDSTGNVAIHYGGTVCGIPVSGTETVKR